MNMIRTHAPRGTFANLLSENGQDLDEEEALHYMIMEYAKVMNGGSSDVVAVPVRFLVGREVKGG